MIEQGLVHSVQVVMSGSYLAADAAAGATTLTLESVLDFNEDGGTLALNGLEYAYTAADFETNTITLATPVSIPAFTADRVDVWQLSTEKLALVVTAGSDDAVTVRIPHALVDRLPEGIRDEGTQESIQFEWIAGEFVMTDVVGVSPVIGREYLDPSLDADLEAVQTSANGKNKIYRQTTQPSSGALGDTWFDSDDGNKIYVHDGTTWVASALGPSAILDLAITNAKIANIDAAKMTIGQIQASQLSATAIDGKTITGALLRTAATGQRVEINSPAAANEVRFYTGDAAEVAPGLLRVPRPTDGLPLGSVNLTSPDLGLGTATFLLWNGGAYMNYAGTGQVWADDINTVMVYGSGDAQVGAAGKVRLYSGGVEIRTENPGLDIALSAAGGITLAANDPVTVNGNDVVTDSGAQTLTNKDLTSTTNTFPFRIATGNFLFPTTSTAIQHQAVVFPAGRFTAAPIVTATARTLATAVMQVSVSDETSTGFTLHFARNTATPTNVGWIAIQA